MITNVKAIVASTHTADFSDKEGYAVATSNGVDAIVASASARPIGVVTSGEAVNSAVALVNFGGVVKVKLDGTPGTVKRGTDLKITATGTFAAEGAGSRVVCATALEEGAADELIDAMLFNPVSRT